MSSSPANVLSCNRFPTGAPLPFLELPPTCKTTARPLVGRDLVKVKESAIELESDPYRPQLAFLRGRRTRFGLRSEAYRCLKLAHYDATGLPTVVTATNIVVGQDIMTADLGSLLVAARGVTVLSFPLNLHHPLAKSGLSRTQL